MVVDTASVNTSEPGS